MENNKPVNKQDQKIWVQEKMKKIEQLIESDKIKQAVALLHDLDSEMRTLTQRDDSETHK